MEQDKNDLPLTPIKCPICGSINIAFTEEYQKSIVVRIVSEMILVIFIMYSAYSIINTAVYSAKFNYVYVIVLAVFYFLFRTAVVDIESKTFTKGICRDCGHTWKIN